MRAIVFFCAVIWLTSAWAQAAREPDERDGPYRSRMRIVDERAPVVPAQEPTNAAFASALNARAEGYLAARAGNVDQAIAQLRAALDTGVLAPIAARSVREDLLALLAQAGRHDEVVREYQRQEAALAPELCMAVAQSAVAIGDMELALQATDCALSQMNDNEETPLSWRQYKVFLLTQLKRFEAAARLAASNLLLTDTDAVNWRNVIELQRAAGQPRLAVATAEMAFDRGLLARSDDVLQLAKLYLATGLPDHAAVALRQHHAQTPADESTLSVLLRAQRSAGSLRDALVTARALSDLTDSPDHLLAQAQLEHELEDASAVIATLRRALRKDLGSRRGQALLLLGENQVASGALRQARRTFREASDVGGVYRDALDWLARLEALDANGPDQDDVAPAAELATETPRAGAPNAPARSASSEQRELDIRRLPRLRFFHASDTATLSSLPDVAGKLQRRVGIGLRRERLSATGPLRFRVDGQALVAGRASTIELGVPVRTSVPPRGRFKNSDLPPLTAAVREYRGNISGLGEAWRQLIADAMEGGHIPGADARTVVMEAPDDTGDGGRFELQLEVMGRRAAGQ